ncbi:hypothetical protein EDC02_5992 [Micromonospora sp. Llam0]|nr:hypothetical protein EDC02_5992 [Micromonospora sp. Llam0]
MIDTWQAPRLPDIHPEALLPPVVLHPADRGGSEGVLIAGHGSRLSRMVPDPARVR